MFKYFAQYYDWFWNLYGKVLKIGWWFCLGVLLILDYAYGSGWCIYDKVHQLDFSS